MLLSKIELQCDNFIGGEQSADASSLSEGVGPQPISNDSTYDLPFSCILRSEAGNDNILRRIDFTAGS